MLNNYLYDFLSHCYDKDSKYFINESSGYVRLQTSSGINRYMPNIMVATVVMNF